MSVYYNEAMQERRLKAFWAAVNGMAAIRRQAIEARQPNFFDGEKLNPAEHPERFERITEATPL